MNTLAVIRNSYADLDITGFCIFVYLDITEFCMFWCNRT